jgi:adenosylcobyric acid synthase
MVQGVSSSAGKSLLVTALGRWFARRGVRVAPFKGANMSNHARVTPEGEMGVAQWLQARACGVAPHVRMNPVLVKPEATGSQVVVRGVVDPVLTRTPWRQRAPLLWQTVADSLAELQAGHDLVVIEGAGSPAETNLRANDLSNMRVAEAADAAVLLVADIDRGGAFAHLYGTWALLEEGERARLAGFVLNKFRGDPALLHPAPADLAARTGMRELGVMPWLAHALPDEDGAAWHTPMAMVSADPRPRVAVTRYPTASNLDELTALAQVADVVWAGAPVDLHGADLVVLPGSKHVVADLAWLRSRGLDRAVAAAAGRGTRVLGICGGMHMLGDGITDPHGVEGAGRGSGWAGCDDAPRPDTGDATGLGLLPVATTFAGQKRTAVHDGVFGVLPPAWGPWSGLPVGGYEIRHGRSVARDAASVVLSDGCGFARGCVLGVSVHGLLEDPDLVRRLLGVELGTGLDAVFDRLADAVDEHLDTAAIAQLAGIG